MLCQHPMGVAGNRKAYIDGITLVLGILDLGFGQGGAILGAPVHGLEPFVDVALFRHLAKYFDLARLKFRLEGEVWIFKIADHAQPLELFAHDVNVFGGKVVAQAAQLQQGNIALFAVCLLDGLQLDGQAVRVVSGHIRRLVTAHIFIADNDILDDFVERGAHVDAAVRIRGPVVQHIPGLALVVLDQFLVKMVLRPRFQHFGLFFGQARPHVKICFGQVDGAVIILWHWRLHSSWL